MRFLVFCQEAFRSFYASWNEVSAYKRTEKRLFFKRMVKASPYCCFARFPYFRMLQKPPITIGGFCVMWK